MDLAELTPVEAVFVDIKASSKKVLLQELAQNAGAVFGVEPRDVAAALVDRERLGSTGVGRGVAIPHCRLAPVSRLCGALARLDTPVAFDAVDGEPVDLVYLLIAPECAGADHLKALARVSRVLRDQEICAKLRGAEDAAAMHAVLVAPERSKAA